MSLPSLSLLPLLFFLSLSTSIQTCPWVRIKKRERGCQLVSPPLTRPPPGMGFFVQWSGLGGGLVGKGLSVGWTFLVPPWLSQVAGRQPGSGARCPARFSVHCHSPFEIRRPFTQGISMPGCSRLTCRTLKHTVSKAFGKLMVFC